jgi:hypothetical protein
MLRLPYHSKRNQKAEPGRSQAGAGARAQTLRLPLPTQPPFTFYLDGWIDWIVDSLFQQALKVISFTIIIQQRDTMRRDGISHQSQKEVQQAQARTTGDGRRRRR